jgi:hypothetical protein
LVLFSEYPLWKELASLVHKRSLEIPLRAEDFEGRLDDVQTFLKELTLAFRTWKAAEKGNGSSFWSHRHINHVLAPPPKRDRFGLDDMLGLRGAVNRQELIGCGSFYLARPWLQHNGLDWLFFDALIFSEIEAFVEDLYKIGVLHQPSLWSFVTGCVSTLLPSWLISFTNKSHKEEADKLREMLGEALDVYTYCAPSVINPVRLGQQLDRAREKGVHFPGIVYSLFDRVTACDRSTFIPFPS